MNGMANAEYQEFESRVVEWVAEWWRGGHLTPVSFINRAPIWADGDDAVELLQHVEARSGRVLGDNFEFQRYFGSEAQLYGLWQRLLGRWPLAHSPASHPRACATTVFTTNGSLTVPPVLACTMSRIVRLIVGTLTMALWPSACWAEVMDKEPSLTFLWSSLAIVLAIAGALARWRPWAALLVTPITLLWGYGLLVELHDPSVGPAILREAGQSYVLQAHFSVVIGMLAGPLIACSSYLVRSRCALWTLTIVLMLMAGVFLTWAFQTAWLSGFPDRDKAAHETWAALQLGAALLLAVIPLVLWTIRRWKRA